MHSTLRSNSGEAELMFDLVESATYGHDVGFEANVSIRAEHWDGDHAHPVAISAEGLWLRAGDLSELRGHILAWTSQPLDRLIPEQLDGSFELTRLPGQRFSITFGSRTDTIAHLNPVVSIILAAGAFRSAFHFVTDQSCLAIFANEIGSHLYKPQPNLA